MKKWRIRFNQIGYEVGRPEWDDEQEIRRFLHKSNKASFFTRDDDFFQKRLCHANYCLVFIDVPQFETAFYIRKVLRHPKFRTKAQRCGKVIRLSIERISWFETGLRFRQHLSW